MRQQIAELHAAPSQIKWSEKIWVCTNKFPPIQQTPGLTHLWEFIGGAFRNTTPQPRSRRTCISHIFVLLGVEPKEAEPPRNWPSLMSCLSHRISLANRGDPGRHADHATSGTVVEEIGPTTRKPRVQQSRPFRSRRSQTAAHRYAAPLPRAASSAPSCRIGLNDTPRAPDGSRRASLRVKTMTEGVPPPSDRCHGDHHRSNVRRAATLPGKPCRGAAQRAPRPPWGNVPSRRLAREETSPLPPRRRLRQRAAFARPKL
jgi:hypothetical protein